LAAKIGGPKIRLLARSALRALPPIADIKQTSYYFAFVPIADVAVFRCQRLKTFSRRSLHATEQPSEK
jgi:hypothetical protein